MNDAQTNVETPAGSHLPSSYNVVALDAVKDEAPEGFRLSRHVAKKDKAGKYNGLQESVACFVPVVAFDAIEITPAIAVALQDALDSSYDRLIRARVEAGHKFLTDELLSVAALE